MSRSRALDYLVYVVVRILICVVQAMRLETGRGLARWLAWLFDDVHPAAGRGGRREPAARLSGAFRR